MIRLHTLVLAAALAGGTLVSTAGAADSVPAVNKDKGGLALKGYDVVAYFTQNKAVPGDAQYETEYQGARYRFASAADRTAFLKEPDKYLPQYGGFCAYGAAAGHLAPADPEAFAIVDGKLYLNYSRSVQKEWSKSQAEAIRKADAQYPEQRP